MNTRADRLRRIALELGLEASARRAEWNRIVLERAERERTAPGIAPIEPAALAALFAEDAPMAWRRLMLLSDVQLVNQAIEYACYLETQGVIKRWGAILECWERRLAEKRAALAELVGCTVGQVEHFIAHLAAA